MHLLLTVNAAWNIWNFRRALVSTMLSEGHRITILAPADEAVPRLRDLGCDFVPLEMDVRGLNPLRDVGLTLRMRRTFKALKPDVILSFTAKPNLYGAMAAKSLGVPFIPNVTGLGTAFLSGSLMEATAGALYRLAFASLPIVFFQNDDDRDLFLKRRLVRRSQTRLLPGSGIDLDHFSPREHGAGGGAPTFLMVARLLRDKGLVEYAEAARQVRAQFPDVRFELLGQAGAANRTAVPIETVKGWAASHGVQYLGAQDDVRPSIAAADCVVLPSYREGTPRTLLEAAAMGRPIITTDVAGCRSTVDNGVSGLLCKVKDAESLAEACLKFLRTRPAERAAMGAAGRSKMEREFDQSLVVEAYSSVIAQIAQRPLGSRPAPLADAARPWSTPSGGRPT